MAIAIGLIKVLLELQAAKRSGVMDVEGPGQAFGARPSGQSPGARTRLFIEDGRIVFAHEGMVAETLGRLLVRDKVITEEQYESVLEWMAEIRARGDKKRLGDLLVELGILTREQLHAALSAQVRHKVVRALGWPQASFAFVESFGPLTGIGKYPSAVEPILLAALRVAERQQIEDLFSQSRSRYAALHADPVPGGGDALKETLTRMSSFRLKPDEFAFARSLDGRRSVAQLLDSKHGAVLASLLLTECLDLLAEARQVESNNIRIATPIDVLAPVAVELEAKRASEPPPAADPAQLAARFHAVRAARVLPPPLPDAGPEDTDALTAPLVAETSFCNGKRLLREHRVPEAAEELRCAAALFAATEYQVWAAWATYRLDASEAHTAALRETAERAIGLQPELGIAYAVLAHVADRSGNVDRARELRARAAALDPEIDAVLEAAARPAAPARADSDARRPKPVAVGSPTPGDIPARGPTADVPNDRGLGAPLSSDPIICTPRPPAAKRSRLPWVATLLAAGGAVAIAMAVGRSSPSAHAPASHATAVAVSALAKPPSVMAQLASAAAAPAPSETATSPTSSAARPNPNPNPSAPSSASPTRASAAPAAAPESRTIETAVAGKGEGASGASAAPSAGSAVDPTKGQLDFPPKANGHRVFVDGRLVGEPPTPIVVACGARKVKVGSSGTERAIDVPCGGHANVTYP